MEWAVRRVVAVGLPLLFLTPVAGALDSNTERMVQDATFELWAAGQQTGAKGLVGTAFAIGPNEFVTAAHLFNTAIGGHFRLPVLVDSRQSQYPIADILRFSEQEDYVVFSLKRPPRITPLQPASADRPDLDLHFAGWRTDGKVSVERGTFSGMTRDEQSGEFDWLRFSGPIWGSAGGGPLFNESGRVVGIVQASARDGGANYALPIELLKDETPQNARIHAMDMLRSLMPAVSSVEPLKAEIPLPLPIGEFATRLQQLRVEYIEREIGPLLEATRGNFVLEGDGAADVCNFLNAQNCQCKGRTGVSGTLVVNQSPDRSLLSRIDGAEDVVETIAGTVVARVRRGGSTDAAAHRHDVTDADYVDFHNRAWHLRSWPTPDRDSEVVSLARRVPDGQVVLTRIVPASLSYAAQLQLKFLSNVIYYECEELAGEGSARMASVTPLTRQDSFP